MADQIESPADCSSLYSYKTAGRWATANCNARAASLLAGVVGCSAGSLKPVLCSSLVRPLKTTCRNKTVQIPRRGGLRSNRSEERAAGVSPTLFPRASSWNACWAGVYLQRDPGADWLPRTAYPFTFYFQPLSIKVSTTQSPVSPLLHFHLFPPFRPLAATGGSSIASSCPPSPPSESLGGAGEGSWRLKIFCCSGKKPFRSIRFCAVVGWGGCMGGPLLRRLLHFVQSRVVCVCVCARRLSVVWGVVCAWRVYLSNTTQPLVTFLNLWINSWFGSMWAFPNRRFPSFNAA